MCRTLSLTLLVARGNGFNALNIGLCVGLALVAIAISGTGFNALNIGLCVGPT